MPLSPLAPTTAIISSTAPDALRITPSSSEPQPLQGISLAGFKILVEAAGGRACLETWTTGRLKYDYLLPATAPARDSFARAVLAPRADASSLVGRATVFLSHAYDYLFLDALDAITAWEARQPPLTPPAPHFYYFDLAVVNQHCQSAIVPFQELRDVFSKGVRDVGRTLFLLRWEAPLSLSRAWCVFELATTVSCKKTLEVVLPPRDEASFQAVLLTDFESVVQKTCSIDVGQATALHASDQVNIHRAIREELGGAADVNKMVIGALRSWMAAAGRAALDALAPATRSRSPLLTQYANLLSELGQREAAMALYQEALTGHSEGGPGTLLALSNYAIALVECGKPGEAAEMHARALAARRSLQGDGHPDTLRSMCNYGSVLLTLGRVGQAETLVREALAGQRAIAQGGPDALESMGVLAAVLGVAGKHGEAEALHREALAGCRASLGARHPSTLAQLAHYAQTLEELGRGEEAEPLHEEALAGRRSTLGEDHPDTLTSKSYASMALKARGKLVEATALAGEVHAARARALGRAHPDTLESAYNLAAMHYAQCNYCAAEPLFKEALAGWTECLGPHHGRTCAVRNALAALLHAQGLYAEAVPLYREALAGSVGALGEAAQQTEQVAANLALCEKQLAVQQAEEAASSER